MPGSLKPSVEMQIIGNELVIGKAAQRQGVVTDVDLAVQRLLLGERVFVQQLGSLCTQVQMTISAVLKGKA